MLYLVPRRRAVLHKANLRELAPAKVSNRKASFHIKSHQWNSRRRASAITPRRRAEGGPTEVRGSQTVQRPHPELAHGLQGAFHTGLQLIVHRSHEVLIAPGARGLNNPALRDRLLPVVHQMGIRQLPGGEEAMTHHQTILTPSLITDRWKISCTNASSNWTPRGQSFSDTSTSAGIAR